MNKVLKLLKESGIPFAYDHFAEGEGPEPPFICYMYPGTDNFSADGVVYLAVNQVRIELYTDRKSPKVERKLEGLLRKYELFYNKEETYIESEKLYEVMYEFCEREDI